MKITSITVQARNKDRVNVSVDGKYRFSLDIFQVADLGIRTGKEYSEQELEELERESLFGKLYSRTLEFALVRPRSQREIRDYLYKKTRDSRTKTGEIRKGVSVPLTERVFDRLVQKGYIDDRKFAEFWIENRNLRKGISARKLTAELRSKGVESSIIDELLSNTERSDESELQKIIIKKRSRYADEQKFIAYLARQGFSYDDIKEALEQADEAEEH